MRYSVTITWANGRIFATEVEADSEGVAEVLAEGEAADAGFGRCAVGVASIVTHPAA